MELVKGNWYDYKSSELWKRMNATQMHMADIGTLCFHASPIMFSTTILLTKRSGQWVKCESTVKQMK